MAAKGGNGPTLRIVLLGKTGAGKSSLGNALTGKKPPKSDPKDKRDEKPPEKKDPALGFKIGRGLKSETVFCDWSMGERNGITLEVTDTPGLCDTHLPENDIYREVAKSVAVAKPGPNIIIFALRCDRRFTPEEELAYKKIKQLFSEEMNNYLILVFNGLDVYDDMDTLKEQRECLCRAIDGFGDKLQAMVKQADGRYFGMNNKASAEEKEQQIQDLIDMMLALVQRNGADKFYRTEMTEQINARLEEMVTQEAKAKGVDRVQATNNLKKDIIAEKVQPGFLSTIAGYVGSAARAVYNGVSDMCSVM